ENESLDLRLSKRWFSVLRAIIRGENADQVSRRMLKTMQRGWQKAQQQLQKYGTSLQELIDATIEQKDPGLLYLQKKRHDYVKLFEIEQQAFDSPPQLMERVVPAGTELLSGEHFRLEDVQISESLSLPLRALDYDLIRIGMAIYAADRLFRRKSASNDRPPY